MFSTTADPGFTTKINRKSTKIYNVDIGMSASIVPAGWHTIRYEYLPPGLRTGATLSLASQLIFFGVVLFEYRYKSKNHSDGKDKHSDWGKMCLRLIFTITQLKILLLFIIFEAKTNLRYILADLMT